MDFFSGIGILVVIIVIGCFLLYTSEYVDNEYNKISSLVKYCDECKPYIKMGLSKENKREITKIFMDPKKRAAALSQKKKRKNTS